MGNRHRLGPARVPPPKKPLLAVDRYAGRRILGFTRSRVFESPDRTAIFLRLGDVYLELFGGAPVDTRGASSGSADSPEYPGSLRHIAFQVDFDQYAPGWRSMWLSDPDGAIVEVGQGYRDAEIGHVDKQPDCDARGTGHGARGTIQGTPKMLLCIAFH